MATFLNRYRIQFASLLLCLFSLHLASAERTMTGGASIVKSVLNVVIVPVQTAIVNTQQSAADLWSGYVYLVGVEGENQALTESVYSLVEENNRLMEELAQSARLKELLAFKETGAIETEAARILGYDAGAEWTKTMTLNKGSGDGIRADMPLLTSGGVVGRVIHSSGGASTALLLTDPRSSIDVIVQRTRVKGVVEGGGERLRLKYVTNLDDVQVGDTIVTAGISGVFPKGLVVGEVRAVEKGDDNFFKEIEVVPSVDLKKIEEVLIVTGWESPLKAALENK